MRRFLLTLLLLLIAVPAFAGDPSLSALMVTADVSEFKAHSASGTPIAMEKGRTLVITCKHVVSSGKLPVSVTLLGKKYPAKFLSAASGTYPDLAVLSVEAELPIVELAAEAPKVDSRIRQWGFCETGSGGKGTYKFGLVTNSRDPNGDDYANPTLTGTLPCKEGDSGAGLFNDEDKLVGVTCRRTDPPNPKKLVLAVPLATVRSFLKDAAVEDFPKFVATLDSKAKPMMAPPVQLP